MNDVVDTFEKADVKDGIVAGQLIVEDFLNRLQLSAEENLGS